MACIGITDRSKTRAAKAFLESVQNGNFYFVAGRITAWDDEFTPPASDDSISGLNSFWDECYIVKKIQPEDVVLAARRVNWEYEGVYNQYDDTDADLATKDFYVFTRDEMDEDANIIYKCLWNSDGGASTIEPATLATGMFGTTKVVGDVDHDGYQWILVGQVDRCDAEKFVTDDYIPIALKTTDDDSLQWQAQEDAVDGAIDIIEVTSAGAAYTDGNWTLDIDSLESDGTGLVAVATVASGVVTGVSITNSGSGYSRIALSMPVAAGGAGATFHAYIPPKGGHGANVTEDILPNGVMLYVKIDASESGMIPVGNDFRQYGIVVDPIVDSTGVIATANEYNQTLTLVLSGVTNGGGPAVYTADETVFVGAALATASATAKVISWDTDTSTLRLTAIRGTFSETDTVTGDTSDTYGTIATVTNPAIRKNTGEMVYLANRTRIIRDNDQAEEFRMVIEF